MLLSKDWTYSKALITQKALSLLEKRYNKFILNDMISLDIYNKQIILFINLYYGCKCWQLDFVNVRVNELERVPEFRNCTQKEFQSWNLIGSNPATFWSHSDRINPCSFRAALMSCGTVKRTYIYIYICIYIYVCVLLSALWSWCGCPLAIMQSPLPPW